MNQLDTLTRINLDDLVSSVGWQHQPALARTLRTLFLAPARRFAQQMIAFDAAVGEFGLAKAAQQTQRNYVMNVRLFSDPLPAGPILALSNHPGMTDTLSLFCALDRRDLKIIALERPFLTALPNTSRHLCYIKDDPNSRTSLVRRVTSHLRAGGAVLTFPAGQIEPDPEVYEGAGESLQRWTDSAGVFLRLAPETAVLPILVRNVIWKKAARLPILRLKKTKAEREMLAAVVQILAHVVWKMKPVTVQVQIGRPIYAKDLRAADTTFLHQALLTEMQHLIEHPPMGGGRDLL